jgi:tetratricopeptide (TPR) repeat protein
MTPELEAKLQGLEEQLVADPESEDLRQDILFEYLGPGLGNEPRRIHHIVEYVRRFPRTLIARCPHVHVYPSESPAGFAQIEQEWVRHQAENPSDPEIAQGHALLIAQEDPDRAAQLLEQAIQANPQHPNLWLELGRVCQEPIRRLQALQQARALGAVQPNLLAWLARAALGAHDTAAAEIAAAELLARVDEARSAYGDKLDWPERGRDLWARARAACESEANARELVGAIGDHANRKHWAHTTLGVLAARRGDVALAKQQLRDSASVKGDHRLSSYGPSFLLARELCTLGEWDAAADYLEACATFWNPEPLRDWVRQLRERRKPEIFED